MPPLNSHHHPPPKSSCSSAAFLGQLSSFCTTLSITNPVVRVHLCLTRLHCSSFFFFFCSATSLSFWASAVRPFCACRRVPLDLPSVPARARVIPLLSSGIAGFRAVLSVDSVVSSGPAPPPHPLHPRPQRRGMEVMRCDGRGRFLAGYYPMSQSHRAWRGQCKGIAGGPGSQNTCSQTFSFCFFFPRSRVGLPIRL